MKIIIAGGGTAGHINPALAIAAELKKQCRSADILYVGAKKGMEARLAPEAGLPFRGISVMGFYRSVSPSAMWHNARAAYYSLTSQREAARILGDFRPDVVVGTGGYVSGPVVLSASKMGIKTLIHEQNAFPGVTTKLLARRADRLLVAVKEAAERLRRPDAMVVGNPVRQDLIFLSRDECRRALDLRDKKMILSYGGSLGAWPISEAVAALFRHYGDRDDLFHLHGTGRGDYERFRAYLRENDIDIRRSNIEVRAYIDDMPRMFQAADLVISRAGALTLSEIEAAGRASILIPSPYVAENHQYHNAMVLAGRGAAVVIEQKDLTGERLIEEVERFLQEPGRTGRFGRRAAEGAVLDAAPRIAAEVIKLAEQAEKAR